MFAGERWIKIVAKRYAGPRSECVKLRSRPRSCDDTALFGRKTVFFSPLGKKKEKMRVSIVRMCTSEMLLSC